MTEKIDQNLIRDMEAGTAVSGKPESSKPTQVATGKDVPRTLSRDVAVGPIRSEEIMTYELTRSEMAENTPETLLRETPVGTVVSGNWRRPSSGRSRRLGSLLRTSSRDTIVRPTFSDEADASELTRWATAKKVP